MPLPDGLPGNRHHYITHVGHQSRIDLPALPPRLRGGEPGSYFSSVSFLVSTVPPYDSSQK